MRNIKTIFILVLSLILFAVSCSNDDKTGVKNNPPENDTEITDGETGSGSSSGGSSETGTGGETGGSEEGDSGEVTPPSELETTEEGYFPPPAGNYSDDKVVSSGYTGDFYNTVVSNNEATKKTTIEGYWIKDGTETAQRKVVTIEKWKQTKKGEKITKTEGIYEKGGEKYTIIYDYASGTLSGTYTYTDGTKNSFNGKKQP